MFSLGCLTQLVQGGDSWTVLKFLDVLQITKIHAEKFIGVKMHSQWIFFFEKKRFQERILMGREKMPNNNSEKLFDIRCTLKTLHYCFTM